MQATLPPGPRMPAALQTIGWWTRPTAYIERLRARYGSRFTLRLLGQPPFVVLTDPDDAASSSSPRRPRSCTPARARACWSRSSAPTR